MDYYVNASSGNDSNAGTSDGEAWATLQKAANTVAAGDTVHVRAGDYAHGLNAYHKTTGSVNSPITFLADSGVNVLAAPNTGITNDSLAGINIEGSGAYWIIDGFHVAGDVSITRAGIRVSSTDHCTIQNCIVDGAFIGIFTSATTGTIIQDNVTRNSTDQHGIYISGGSVSCTIRRNICNGNNWDGIHVNGTNANPNHNNIIDGNECYGNLLSGMDLEGIHDCIFRNNVVYANGKHALTFHSVDQSDTPPCVDNLIVNNTLVANEQFCIQFGLVDDDNTVFNNILIQTVATVYGSIGTASQSSPTLLKSDYNLVVDKFSTTLGTSQINFAAWKSQTGQDAHSAVVADPDALFTNLAENDYHVQAASAGIDAGAQGFNGYSAAALDRDANNRPQGSSFDIGAYETVDGSTSTPLSLTSLSATAADPFSIHLTWTDPNTNCNGTLIERSTDGGSTWFFLAGVAAGTVAYTDSGLTTGQTYYYRVTAYNYVGSADPSGSAHANGPDTPDTPDAPTNLTATLASTTLISLVWDDNTSIETGYSVERSDDGGLSYSVIATLAANSTSYDDDSLSTTQRYYYRVRAINTTVYSDYSNVDSAITGPAVPGTYSLFSPSDSPIAPAGSDASAVTLGVRFRSEYPGTVTGIKFYKPAGALTNSHRAILWSTAQDILAAQTQTDDSSSGWQTVVFDTPYDIEPNVDYVASVFIEDQTYYLDSGFYNSALNNAPLHARATGDGGGNGLYAYGSVISYPGSTFGGANYWIDAVVTVSASLPQGPTELTVSQASGTTADLAWTDNSTDETGFKIERGTDGVSFAQIDTVSTGVTSYHDSGLSNGTTYFYRVRATNGTGDSGYTNTASTASPTTPATPVIAVSTSAAEVNQRVSWDDQGPGIAYNLYRDGVLIASRIAGTGYTDTQAADAQSHVYAVEAFNLAGQLSDQGAVSAKDTISGGSGGVFGSSVFAAGTV